MKLRPVRQRSRLAHSVRVAAVATFLIAVLYAGLAVILNLVNANHLVAQVDSQLSERLRDVAGRGDLALPGRIADDSGLDEAPIVVWRVNSSGRITSSNASLPLPVHAWSRSATPSTATIGSTSFRLLARPEDGGWLVAGQSLTETNHVQSVLVTAELIAGPILVLAIFFGSLAIGLEASGPVEQARRRQLELTADASHELRTPLSVIEAEVGLALSVPRPASSYRDTLERVGAESKRLGHIVGDLLWLARFDSEPSPPGDEPVDVGTIASGIADRFGAVAHSKDLSLSVQSEIGAWIKAPPEWIDRLIGVLVDNACRYAEASGSVQISVARQGNRVVLSVDDSGPGIPPQERPRLFDRFHRATTTGGGAGLGLAIGDAVVRSTGGTWRVGDSPTGGAHMEVSWHGASAPAADHEPEPPGGPHSDDQRAIGPRGDPGAGMVPR